MDISIARKDLTEIILHGVKPVNLMQLLAGVVPSGKGLIKHLEISEIQGADYFLARGDFPHEKLADHTYLMDAEAAVTFLSNIHLRKCELTILPAFPEPGPERDAILAPQELYPKAVLALGATFYFVCPNEDTLSIATSQEFLVRHIFVGAVVLMVFGRPHPEELAGEGTLYDVLAPLAEDTALHIRKRKADYPGERRLVAIGHAIIWFRGMIRGKLRAQQREYRYPASVTQHEIIATPNANRIQVGEARKMPLATFFGTNRYFFDRFGPAYFLFLLVVFLGALIPAFSTISDGITPVGAVAIGIVLIASYALADVAVRE